VVADFVGRADPVARVTAWLRNEPERDPLAIASISGPGGVGKSSLLAHVLRNTELHDRSFLTLRLQGIDGSRTLTDLVTRDLIRGYQDLIDGKNKVFGVTLEARRKLELMDAAARGELEAECKTNPDLAKAAAAVFALGIGALELVPLPHAKVAARLGNKIDPKLVANVVERVQRAAAYQSEKRLWNGVLPDLLQRGERNRLRANLAEALAGYLITDLSAMLAGYRAKDWRRLLPPKIPGKDNLLLIIDDYESVSEVMTDFLLTHFVPALAKSKFRTLLIVLGRDRLGETHPGCKHHFERYLLNDPVHLASLSAEEAAEYVLGHGILDPVVIHRIVDETAGFPYLLHAEVEAELKGGRSALSLKLFFDRTTRWMSDEQKGWLRALAYLQSVDREAIAKILPSEDPDRVLTWFKTEASIRDPDAKTWCVLPIIRSRVQDYVKTDSARQHAELQRAAEAGA
jgi:hypothetical protein